MPAPGFPFLFGLYGARPTRESVVLLKETGACGVLLLARNIESPRQLRAFTDGLVQKVGRPLLFAVDHEGGWVLRFKSGVTALPGNAALGRSGDPRLAYATGRLMALELRRLGVQLNLAPVLDVVTDKYNPGIGIRSFGRDPALVGRLGAALIRGLQENGVAACAKHFPGKGAATVDAHVTLPTIRLPKRIFERVHLRPFADAVRAGVRCVMTSHVRFPALDSQVATFSPKITRTLLRDRLGFDGVVIADDLCMGAVAESQPIQTAALAALDAGHDMLIIAHDARAQREAAELLQGALESGQLPRERWARACGRIEGLLERPATAGKIPDGAPLGRRIARAGLERVQQGALRLPLKRRDGPLLVLFPDFEEVRERFTFENGPRGPERALRKRLARWGRARLERTPVESGEIGGLEKAVSAADRILFFCFEAMRFPGQKAVLELLKRRAPERTAAVLIRNPWDRQWLDQRMTALDSAGYRLSQLEAALGEALA